MTIDTLNRSARLAVFLIATIGFGLRGAAACVIAETEDNNSVATANFPLCSDIGVTGSLGALNDVDWVRFNVTSAGVVAITLHHTRAHNLDWHLYNSDGARVAASIGTANPAASRYFASSVGSYRLKIVRNMMADGEARIPANASRSTPPSRNPAWSLKVVLPAPDVPAVTGKVWLNGGGILQSNTAIFVDGLRQATGRNFNTPNINSTANCDENWDTTPCPRVAVITAAALNQAEGVDKFANDLGGLWSYGNLFRRHGFAPKHILSHWDTYASNSSATTAQGQANIAIIQQADLVYVIGGDQSRLARTFLKDDGSDGALLAAIRARYRSGHFIYAGDSAGTAIASSMTYGDGISIGYLNQGTLREITPADCPYDASGSSCLRNPDAAHPDHGSKIKGFGFVVNANIDTHFDNRSNRSGRLGRLLVALKDIGPTVAYGIDQDTAFYLDGDLGTVFGSGAVYVAEADIRHFPSGSSFSARGVRLSYLTQGDSYRRSDGHIGTTKPPISLPRFNGHADSTNIFAVNASGLGNTTRTFTRMIDQTDLSNIGIAPADSANGNPLSFELVFSRDAATLGYRVGTSGSYTIARAVLDVEQASPR